MLVGKKSLKFRLIQLDKQSLRFIVLIFYEYCSVKFLKVTEQR